MEEKLLQTTKIAKYNELIRLDIVKQQESKT